MHRRDLPLSGCDVDWDAMSGGARARHCDHCDRRVTDLSAGTEAEAEALLSEDPGCVRYRVDRAGRLLFRRPLRALAAAATLLLADTAAAEPMGVSSGATVGETAPDEPVGAAPGGRPGVHHISLVDGDGLPVVGAEVEIEGLRLVSDDEGVVIFDPAAHDLPPADPQRTLELWVTVHGYETIYWSGPGEQIVVEVPLGAYEVLMGAMIEPHRRLRPLRALKRLLR